MNYNKRRNIILIAIILAIIAVLLVVILTVKKLTSKEYKLGKLGYTFDEINIILNNDKITFDEVMNMEYDKNLPKIIEEKYFIKDNLKDYLEFMKTDVKVDELDEVTSKDIVAMVNVGSNKNFYTDTIKTDTSKGVLMLVNKFNYLDKEYKPEDLVNMALEFAYQDKQVSNEAYLSFKSLVRDAKEENLTIIANSSYRSYEDQEYVYNQKKGSLGTEKADLIAIHPGYSEHQTGLAIDVSTPGANHTTFATTDEFKWLENNAHKYGFILRYPKGKQYLTGIAYESWHYRYVGIEAATKIHDEGITFDEYYEFYLR